MNNYVMIMLYVVWVAVSYMLYYWTGKIVGGMKYGKVITAVIVTLFWIVNSIGNAGGVDWLLFLIRRVDGFWIGWLASLLTMQFVAYRGVRNHLILGKKRWLI